MQGGDVRASLDAQLRVQVGQRLIHQEQVTVSRTIARPIATRWRLAARELPGLFLRTRYIVDPEPRYRQATSVTPRSVPRRHYRFQPGDTQREANVVFD